MFKKLFFSAVISAILSVNAFGVDLLASVTNGKISDNSPGVKVLSLEEDFTYKVITYDTNLRTYHNITSSQLLNNNAIIKELTQKYKTTFENILGGLR